MIYLSGHVTKRRHDRLGFIITPDMGNTVPDDCWVAADNACYSNPKDYSDERYLRFLDNKMPPDKTLFATAPDVLGNHAETVKRSIPMLKQIRDLGLETAFVAQDGWQDNDTPWDYLDAIFVGGSTEFKFRGGRSAVAAAKQRGKWTHMGRVNSLDRLRAACSLGCDSADGTFLRFGPDTNWPKLKYWLDHLTDQPEFINEGKAAKGHPIISQGIRWFWDARRMVARLPTMPQRIRQIMETQETRT